MRKYVTVLEKNEWKKNSKGNMIGATTAIDTLL